MSQSNAPFPSRNIYAASSSKLPDRTNTAGAGAQKSTQQQQQSQQAQQYAQSTFGRRPEPSQSYAFAQSTAPQQSQYGAPPGRQSLERDQQQQQSQNALVELSEDQRTEIEESVSTPSHSPRLINGKL
jgi:Ca2+-binding EF-hand superfamily protein